MKLFTAIAALTLIAAPAANAGYSETFIYNETRSCHTFPARQTGWIQVGIQTTTLINPAYTKCFWKHDNTRTAIYSSYSY